MVLGWENLHAFQVTSHHHCSDYNRDVGHAHSLLWRLACLCRFPKILKRALSNMLFDVLYLHSFGHTVKRRMLHRQGYPIITTARRTLDVSSRNYTAQRFSSAPHPSPP